MLEDKIKEYIDNNFSPIYAISMLYQTYLIGGSIIDIMLDEKPRDLDFVLYTMNDKEAINYIIKFIEKYNLRYKFNSFGGYKILYKDSEIDLWQTKDLFDSIEYNADGILYDVENRQIISLSFNDYLLNGPKRINETNNSNFKSDSRYLKLHKRYNEFKEKGWC